MNDEQPVFCGKCGTPNPAGNSFCRKCGHRLDDDIIEDPESLEEFENSTPQSPVEGVEIVRYPLVDPETGEEIVPTDLVTKPALNDRSQENLEEPPRKGSVALWSLAIHFLAISLLGLATMIVLSQLGLTPSQSAVENFQSEFEALRQRAQANEIDAEQTETEGRRLLERHGFLRLAMLMSGPVLLAFFIAGLIVGKLWRPRRLVPVGISGLIFGLLCSLCLISTIVWPIAVGLSLLGAYVGRRWR